VSATKSRLENILEVNPNITLLASLPSFKREDYKRITKQDYLSHFLENLKNARELGIHVNINMVAHQMNKDQVYDEAKFLYENYGITSFAVTPMLRPALRTLDGMDLSKEDNIKIFQQLIKLREEDGLNTAILEVTPKCGVPEELRDDVIFSRGCSAGKITSTISYNGDLRVCAHAPFSEGNLLEVNFQELWQKMKPWREQGYVPEECNECVELDFCHGGCRFAAYQENQSLDTKDYRMEKPITTIKKQIAPDINLNAKYEVLPFKFRNEGKGQYLLYRKGKLLFANEGLKNFLDSIKEQGYLDLRDIPSGPLREKAENFAKVLYYRKFINIKDD
jgi:radical SAM protein with 4Fe4S-binding SPASM domain